MYIAPHESFVVADIPGLIEGAAEGAGLGIQFLKHLSRTRLLLHLVELCANEEDHDLRHDFITVVNELKKYSNELEKKDRWLVFNKTDLIDPELLDGVINRYVDELDWHGPVFAVSAISKSGAQELCKKIYSYLHEQQSATA